MPRAPSAAVRSGSSSNATSNLPECQRAAPTVSVVSVLAEPRGASARRLAPTANRRSGSSVRTSTMTSPRRPCGFPIRPTTTSMSSAATIHVHEVDARTAAPGECRDHGAERRRRTTASADHLAEVVGMHPDLEDGAAAQLLVADRDLVGVVHDPPDQVLERLCEHGGQSASGRAALACSVSLSSAVSAVSASMTAPSGVSTAGTGCSAGASTAGASSAGVSAAVAFLAVVLRAEAFLVTASEEDSPATSLSASLKRSSLSRLGSATLRVPSVPLMPRCFCQSPVMRRILATASEGWAPTPSQYCARSETTSM